MLYSTVLDGMAGWLVDVDVPDGLTIDTDLRWRPLHALVAHGRADEARIAEEAAATPRRWAAAGRAGRALLPDRQAKERARMRAVHDYALPNAVTEAAWPVSPTPRSARRSPPSRNGTSRRSPTSGPAAPAKTPSRS